MHDVPLTTHVSVAKPLMIDCRRPVTRYTAAVFACLASGTPSVVFAHAAPELDGWQEADPALARARMVPRDGIQSGATVLVMIGRPAMDHARPASLIATALRSTKSQTRIPRKASIEPGLTRAA